MSRMKRRGLAVAVALCLAGAAAAGHFSPDG
jgi:hypothetical protein